MAAWYVTHLGMRIIRKMDKAQGHFLADPQNAGIIEIYGNDEDAIPDYASMHPLRLHLAFLSDDPDATIAALTAAGATLVENEKKPDGTQLAMLRDPWGLAIQLVKRATPLF
jgi:catechol 2,3-dioxygenase-like lactoylglutathione lyase family enzyme